MSEENEQPEVQDAVEGQPEAAKPQKDKQWFPVSFRKDILARVDAICEGSGVKRARAKYVHSAVLKQLEMDEAQRRNVSDDNTEQPAQEPGV